VERFLTKCLSYLTYESQNKFGSISPNPFGKPWVSNIRRTREAYKCQEECTPGDINTFA
jgi:hypothetical protein